MTFHPTPASVAARLISLAEEMERVGDGLQKLDVEHAREHGEEMVRAGEIAREWSLELSACQEETAGQ